jgi:hypothetical protein
MLRGLIKQVSTLFYGGQSNLDRRILLGAFEESQKQFMELEKQIRRCNRNDSPGDEASHFEPFSEGRAAAAD